MQEPEFRMRTIPLNMIYPYIMSSDCYLLTAVLLPMAFRQQKVFELLGQGGQGPLFL